jgi:hypothetical protein
MLLGSEVSKATRWASEVASPGNCRGPYLVKPQNSGRRCLILFKGILTPSDLYMYIVPPHFGHVGIRNSIKGERGLSVDAFTSIRRSNSVKKFEGCETCSAFSSCTILSGHKLKLAEYASLTNLPETTARAPVGARFPRAGYSEK